MHRQWCREIRHWNKLLNYLYARNRQTKREPEEPLVLKFGEGEQRNQGVVVVKIPTTDRSHIHISVKIVSAYRKLMRGIEILHKQKRILNFDSKSISTSGKNGKFL